MTPAASLLLATLMQLAPAPGDTSVAVPTPDSVVVMTTSTLLLLPLDAQDTVRRRPRAVEVSDAYATRLRIHKLASYTMIPLFVVQTVAGNQLYQADQGSRPVPGWAKSTHSLGAAGLGALFTVNTVTGVWNAWESRDVEQGRGRRLLHSALMLASDAGFTYAGIKLADEAKRSPDGRSRHRRVAYISMGAALAGYGVMLVQ
jgi:hypothetical protein